MNNIDAAVVRIQRYEDDIPDVFHAAHDNYMNGVIDADSYADTLEKIYSTLKDINLSASTGYDDNFDMSTRSLL